MPSRFSPNFLLGHTCMIWSMFWFGTPHSHSALGVMPHLCIRYPTPPWPVRNQFKVALIFPGMLWPGCLFVKFLMRKDLYISDFSAFYCVIFSILEFYSSFPHRFAWLKHRLLQNFECSWIGLVVWLLSFDHNLSNALISTCQFLNYVDAGVNLRCNVG